jgi:enolase-phosphatase E1
MSLVLVARAALLDIEGTTSPVAYVHQVLFPYARRELAAFLAEHDRRPEVRAALEQAARDAGSPSLAAWAAERGPPPNDEAAIRAALQAHLDELMARDVKATGLKELQGLIWEAGFRAGTLKAEIFPDVPGALARWKDFGIDRRIYSSGSNHAQRLFFGHTVAGDLLPWLSGHYDTTSGPKREAESYRRIAADWKLPAESIVFFSDIVAELDAARTAGMQTVLTDRPGNAPTPPGHGHATVRSLDEVTLQRG